MIHTTSQGPVVNAPRSRRRNDRRKGLRGVETSRAQMRAESRNAEGCGIRMVKAIENIFKINVVLKDDVRHLECDSKENKRG